MSERIQRVLWVILGVIAAVLSVATVYVYMESRRIASATAGPPYRIAYVSFSEPDWLPQIYTCDLEGEDIRPLAGSREGDVFPVCEPIAPGSGREPRIAFLRFPPLERDPSASRGDEVGTPGGVYVVSSSGEATKVSGEVPRILTIAPSWSPDGKQLAFAGVEDLNGDGKYRDDEAAIYVCDVEKGPPKRVATVNTMGLRLLWSPVASQLILQVKKPNVPVPVAHLLDLRSGKLTSRDDATTVGCWSPDGQHIAAYSMLDRKIHVLHTDGSEEYGLDTPSGYVGELLWLPANTKDSIEDAERLLVVSASQPMSSMSGQLHIRSAFPGGGEAWKRLTDDETNAAYLAASPDGRYVAYTLLTGDEPEPTGDLYVLEIGQDEPRRLTSAPGFEGLATWIPTGKRER